MLFVDFEFTDSITIRSKDNVTLGDVLKAITNGDMVYARVTNREESNVVTYNVSADWAVYHVEPSDGSLVGEVELGLTFTNPSWSFHTPVSVINENDVIVMEM